MEVVDHPTYTPPRKIRDRSVRYKQCRLVTLDWLFRLDRRLRSALVARWSPDQMTRADWFGAAVRVDCVVGYPQCSNKWPHGICAALLRSLHCYGLVLAKEREEDP